MAYIIRPRCCRYQAILEHGQPASRGAARGRNSSISSYMLSAFTRALDLFREAIRDHTMYLKRKLVVNKRPVCMVIGPFSLWSGSLTAAVCRYWRWRRRT